MSETSDLFINTELRESSGIFYENIGNVNFYSSHWKLITYTNISTLEYKLKIFQDVAKQTIHLCNNPEFTSHYACKTSLILLLRLQTTIEEQDRAFKDLIGHFRHRRGLFDAVGKIFKVLIGTLDSDDAEHYNNVINDLMNGERDMTSLLRTQSQVVQSTISNFNSTMINIQHVEETFNKNIQQMQLLATSVNSTLLEQNIGDHITLLLLTFTELNREYSNLIDSILLAKQNILHPSVLTPEQILTELSKSKRNLPPNTNYPTILNKANIYKILNTLTLSVYYMESKLIYLIHVPLIQNTPFILYKLFPLPKLTVNNTYIFIKPTNDYIAMSVNKLKYSLINTLLDCKTISNDNIICPIHQPLSNTYSQPSCESELLINHVKMPQSCNIDRI